MELTEIKPSPIHGLGVFIKTDLSTNSVICEYYGEEMSWKDFKAKYGEYKNNSLNTYPMRRIWKIIVAKEEPYKSKNIINFINEDIDNPNVYLKNKKLYSLRELKNGEELLLVYPKNYNRYWSYQSNNIAK